MKRLADIVRLILLVSVTMVSVSETVGGQDWGYDTVVESLPRSAWLDRVMMFCLPYHPAYEAGDTIKPMPWAQRLQEAGFVLAGMYPDGFCRLYEPVEGEAWPAKCREEVAHMHALGMKVIAGGPLDIHFGPLCRPEVIWSGRGTPKPQTAVFQDAQANQKALAVQWADNTWAVATPGGGGRLTVDW